MKFSLVSTVYNEVARLQQSIADIEAQTVLPSEIVITDAGSTDGTWERLLFWQSTSNISIVLLQRHGCNIAEGRNLAIDTAEGPLILSTDFGCRYHRDWTKSMIKPFLENESQVVGGAFTVDEASILTVAAKAAYILNDGYHVNVSSKNFVPSSRSIAYYKHIHQSIGGYCEWLTLAADDYVFGKLIQKMAYPITFVTEQYVYWERHQRLANYCQEAFRYGLGDGEANVNTRNFVVNSIEIICRFLFFTLAIYLLSLIVIQKASYTNLAYLIPFVGGLRTYIRYCKQWLKFKSSKYDLRIFLFGFLLLEATRLYYIKGYITGRIAATPLQKSEAAKLKLQLA